MSVINKMLRDLDQRNLGPSTERKHTVSVAVTNQTARPPRKSGVLRVATVALIVLALVGISWFAWWQTRVADLPQKPVQVKLAATAMAPPAAAVPLPSVSQPASQPALPALPASATLPEPKPVTVAPAQSTPASSIPHSVPANPSLRVETSLNLPKVTAEQPAQSVLQAPPPLAAGQRLMQAGREAQAQAQTLWNSGAKEAAMELLQQAVGGLEASLSTEPMPSQSQLLSVLARDLTRMQLADGRPAAAWDLLVRLERLLPNDADLWAVRGNAAQRLGRHQDSAHAYMAALQIRPNEQRWLLGAAVSLAASGQTAAAAGMAERALATGPISAEVQAYLRQMGVPLKDK